MVRKEVKYIENDNTVLYSKLWVRSMQNAVLFHHSDNIRNQDTLRNVTSSSLVKAKQLSFQKAALYIPRLSQYVSKIGKENIQVYYIAIHYNVKRKCISIRWHELFSTSIRKRAWGMENC